MNKIMKRAIIIVSIFVAVVLVLGAAYFIWDEFAPYNPQISFLQAEEIALERVGGGVVTDMELDRTLFRLVYEVEVRQEWQEFDVWICARSGEVLGFRMDN